MKSTIIKKIISLAMVGVFTISMVGCGKSEATTTETAVPTSAPTETAEAPTETAAAPTETAAATETAVEGKIISKIALLLPGVITDQSWNTLAFNALQNLDSQGFDTAYTESVEVANIEATFRTYADQGFELLIGHGSQFGDAAIRVAADYPDKYFFTVGKQPENTQAPSNCGFVDAKEYEAAYLCGIAAAMTTQSKVVSYLGGMETASQNADKNAFIDGVASIDPSIKVITVMAGTFGDSALGKESATAMIEQGADVLMHTCDTTGLGLIEAAKEKGVYIIGYGADQKELAPDLMITSCIASTQMVIEGLGDQISSGTFGGVWKCGILEGVVYLGEYGDFVSDDIKNAVEEAKSQIVSGELVIEEKTE